MIFLRYCKEDLASEIQKTEYWIEWSHNHEFVYNSAISCFSFVSATFTLNMKLISRVREST